MPKQPSTAIDTSRTTAHGGARLIGGLAALTFIHGGALASAPPKIIGFGPDLIIVLTTAPVRDKKNSLLIGAELQGEVTSETVAGANGWRSMRAVMDISCADRRDRVRSMTVFADHNGKGEGRILKPPADWISSAQNTDYGLTVVNYFCGGAGSKTVAAAAIKPAIPQTAAERPSVGKTSPGGLEIAAESDAEVAQISPTVLTPENNATTNGMGDINDASRPSERDAKRVPKPAPPPKSLVASGPFAVQIGSATTQTDAEAIFNRLKISRADLPPGRQSRIEPALVQGQHHYRALVTGFPDAASAAHFCGQLKNANGCMVRRTP